MQFLLIICHDDAFHPTDSLFTDIAAWIADAKTRGIRVHGNPLRPADSAVTVRVRGGRVIRVDAPFADSGEKMCAYELLECGNLEEAVDAAARHPMARVASIEVRPVWNELVS